MDDRTQDGQHLVESRELPEPLWADRTRPITLDRTRETQHLIESRELLELLWADRTRPVTPDTFGRSLQSCIRLYHFDLMLNSNSLVSGHFTKLEFGHFHLVPHLGSKYRTRPVLIPDVSGHFCLTTTRLDKIMDASGPNFGHVRSLCDQRD